MNKDEFKEELKKLNFEEDYIDEVSQYVDNAKDIESLCEKIKFLNKVGVQNEGIENIICENPLFLTTSIDTVKTSVNFFKNIKIDNLATVLEVSSEVLSTSDKIMGENFKLLKVLMSEKELLNILKLDAEIITFNTDYLEKRLEFFVKNGLKDKVKEIIINSIESFEDEEDEIDLEYLKSL